MFIIITVTVIALCKLIFSINVEQGHSLTVWPFCSSSLHLSILQSFSSSHTGSPHITLTLKHMHAHKILYIYTFILVSVQYSHVFFMLGGTKWVYKTFFSDLEFKEKNIENQICWITLYQLILNLGYIKTRKVIEWLHNSERVKFGSWNIKKEDNS